MMVLKRVEMLTPTNFEGQHVEAGTVREFPAVFAQSLVLRGRARYSDKPNPAAAEVKHSDPVATNADSAVTHGDPRGKNRKR